MNEIEKELADLKLFADPFAPSSFRKLACDRWVAEFDRRGTRLELLREADGKIYCSSTKAVKAGNFRSLLASPDFANLEYLARSIRHAYSAANENWMEVPFAIDAGTQHAQSFEEVNEFLSSLTAGSVVGLEGPAGAGKTHFIERLALHRAANLLGRSHTDALVVPVTSAGKVLSAIDDRIDGSLGALRASFNRIELPALMRQGLISIAIDGFDELSDSRGYDNSWSALRELIGEVGKESLIILSGRDSFIGIDTLQNLIGASVELAGAKLHSLKLDFPSAGDAVSWLSEVSTEWHDYSEELKSRLEAFHWLRRPFFVSQISKVKPELFLDSGDEPIVLLCDGIVEREITKLVMPSDVPQEVGRGIVNSILTEVARTMVDYEVDHVDSSLLEVAVEIACEEHLPHKEDFKNALVARARTITLLEPAPGTGDSENRMFPHEKVKAFFYCRHLMSELGDSDAFSTPLGLRRSQLSISDLSVLRALLTLENSSVCKEIAKRVASLLAEQPVGTTAYSNLAAIGLACAADLDKATPFVVSGGSIIDAVLVERPVLELRNAYINRLQAIDADLRSCKFDNCEFGEIVISDITKFGASKPSVHLLKLQHKNGDETEYREGADISAKLGYEVCHARKETEIVVPQTLEILARLMLRGYWVRLSSEDRRGRRVVERPDWDLVRRKLQESGFLEIRNIGAGGRPDEFAHLQNAENFLDPRDSPPDIKVVIIDLAKHLDS